MMTTKMLPEGEDAFLSAFSRLKVSSSSTQNAEQTAVSDDDFPFNEGISLHQHQRTAISKCVEAMQRPGVLKTFAAGGCLLTAPPGHGKTLIALCVFDVLRRKVMEKDASTPKQLLVICPKSVVHEWAQSVPKFFQTKTAFPVVQVVKSPSESVRPDSSIVICSLSSLAAALPKSGTSKKMDKIDPPSTRPLFASVKTASVSQDSVLDHSWLMAVLDESHAISNLKTRNYRACMLLHSKFSLALSGTPLRNAGDDLWPQLKWCGLLRNIADLSVKRSVAELGLVRWIVHQHAEESEQPSAALAKHEENKENLDHQPSSTSASKALCGPGKQHRTLHISLSKSARDEYDRCSRAAQNALAAVTRLRSFCAMAKMDTLMELISSTDRVPADAQVLVFSNFVDVLEELSSRLRKADATNVAVLCGKSSSEERKRVVDAFCSNKVRVLAMSYKVGAEGLNLTAATHVILAEPWWCPSSAQQAAARAFRIGQTEMVTVWECIVRGTVEEHVEWVQHGKHSAIRGALRQLTH